MSQFVNNIYEIHNNIFSLTPIIISFYKNLKSRDKDLLLAYFVLPIVLTPDIYNEIKTLKVTSNLTRIVRNKKLMAGFHNRFEDFKQITNDCIQYANDCNYIKIEDNMSVKVINNDILYTDTSLKQAIELASQLHKIFTLDIIDTYYLFGINKI